MNMNGDNDDEFNKYCKNYKYLPSILEARKRIITFGDIHGDFSLLINCLKIAKVINDKNDWIGDDTVVVQVGDQIDSCRPGKFKCTNPNATKNDKNDDVKILKFMTLLNTKAMKHGGYVYSLLGNHEILNVMGQFNYVSYENIVEFENYDKTLPKNMSKINKGIAGRKKAFEKGGELAKFLACTRMTNVIIGNFLFTHSGILPEYLNKLKINNQKDLIKINNFVRKWLLGLIDDSYVSDIILTSNYSMFWNRILGAIPHNVSNDDEKCVKYVDSVLKILNVGHMIIGHTVQENIGINSVCDDKIWKIDIGGSHAFDFLGNRKIQILEILDDKQINILQ